MATSTARVQLALAPAGSGKTTAMRVRANVWKDGGLPILGLAPSAAAAAALAEATGMEFFAEARNWVIIAVSGVFFAMEFVADAVPGFDMVWNALHPLIRVPVAALLAYRARPNLSPALPLLAPVGGGGASDLRFRPHRRAGRAGWDAPRLLGDDPAAAVHSTGGAADRRDGARAPGAADGPVSELAAGLTASRPGQFTARNRRLPARGRT